MKPVGIIVGRFQVPKLHEGHKQLIDHVISQHDKVIIFLGLSPIKCEDPNPLDFEARKQMLLAEYPDITVLYIKDTHDDKVWSTHLDEMIKDLTAPEQEAILYGSRDSFANHYFGKYPVEIFEQKIFISGTKIREKIASKVKGTEEFRIGAIWHSKNQFPKAIPTVDVGIFNDNYTEILLGRKKEENGYRLIGGFVKPGDNWETTARREVREETSLEITDLKYIGSYFVDCWRYKKCIHKITTTLFATTKFCGRPEPGDDIYELKWFNVNNIDIKNDIVEEHRHLVLDIINKTRNPN